MGIPLTMHERNLLDLKEREAIRAAVPAKLEDLAKQMTGDLVGRFTIIKMDRLWEFEELLQEWLRKQFPDLDHYPRFVASVDSQQRIQFEGLKEWLHATVTEQDLAAHTIRSLRPRPE